MDKFYFASSNGNVRDSDGELYHFGWKKKDAKYIKREWKKGKWVYTYPDDKKDAAPKKTDTAKKTSSEYDAELAYNSQKNSWNVTTTSSTDTANKVSSGKQAVTKGSSEYEAEVAYNSQKNDYGNATKKTSETQKQTKKDEKSWVDRLIGKAKDAVDNLIDKVTDADGERLKRNYSYSEKQIKKAEDKVKQAEKDLVLYDRSVDELHVRLAKEELQTAKDNYNRSKEAYENTRYAERESRRERMNAAIESGKDWIDNLFEAHQNDAKQKRSDYADEKEAAVRADAEERKAIKTAVKAQNTLDDARVNAERLREAEKEANKRERAAHAAIASAKPGSAQMAAKDEWDKVRKERDRIHDEHTESWKKVEKAREDLVQALEKLETAGTNRKAAEQKAEAAYREWLRANDHPLRKLDEWLEDLLGTR